ncbi:MAG: hypothetical protein KDI88_09620 [Gammaproteobacteria bacterium]|nr:hypothetical protein [Gammaproteobacteria bacterium]
MRKTKTAAIDLTKLDDVAKRIDVHDARIGEVVGSLSRIDQRLSGLSRELSDLREQANRVTAGGDFDAADGIARDIAAKDASLAAAEAARADIAKQLGRLIDAGAELEAEAEQAFTEAVHAAYTQMLEDLRNDLRERLSPVWSAAVAAGINVPARVWWAGNFQEVVNGMRLLPPDRAVPGAPRSWPRCSSLDVARELVADTETEQAA